MPIYEFQCRDCKAVFEKLVTSPTATTEVVCRQCGSANVSKILSAPSQGAGKGSLTGLGNAGGCGGPNPRFR